MRVSFSLTYSALKKLSTPEIVSFDEILNELLEESNNIKLWVAAAIINQGSSPEEFRLFNLWLISKGQSVYENALKNPDSLADVITQSDIDEGAYFEEFGYIAYDVHEARIGDDIEEENEPNMESLEQWDCIDIDEMHKRFPNLMRRLSDRYLRLLADAHIEGKLRLVRY